MEHAITVGNVYKNGKNYRMKVYVDRVPKYRSAKTSDYDEALRQLTAWRRELEHGIVQNSRHRYEHMRDAYVESGKNIRVATLRDLNAFFKNKPLSQINAAMALQFIKWRESKPEVLEYKAKMLAKEIEWRVRKAESGGKLSDAERKKIDAEATRWVENGVKATTNRRLRILIAMFNYYRKIGGITNAPYIPTHSTVEVDNVRLGTVTLEDAQRLLKKLPKEVGRFIEFIYTTGMRSGAAQKLTWDMVDTDSTLLTIPAHLTKNKEPMTLPLVDGDGMPRYSFVADAKRTFRSGPLFPMTEDVLLDKWNRACHALGLGIYDPKTRSYRGLRMHDLRRTALGNLRKNGVPETVAMSISGHKTASVFRRYSIIDPSEKQAALDKVPRLERQPERPVATMKRR